MESQSGSPRRRGGSLRNSIGIPCTQLARTVWRADWRLRALCLGLTALLGCASTSAPSTHPASSAIRTPAGMPRSSIAAILGHRAELQLDPTQVKRLEQLASELDVTEARIEKDAAAGRTADKIAHRPAAWPAEAPRRGGRGAGPGGGPGGGGGGGGRRGGMAVPAPTAEDVESAMDQADTVAFLEAEKVLRPEQVGDARDIAERHREALYDAREKARANGASHPSSPP